MGRGGWREEDVVGLECSWGFFFGECSEWFGTKGGFFVLVWKEGGLVGFVGS